MSVIHLDKEDFNDIISNGKVVVDFFATWCGPCKMLGPVFEKVSDEVNDVKFVKLDVDKFNDIARQYRVMSVPTLILFENGKEVKKEIGFMSEDKLKDFIG